MVRLSYLKGNIVRCTFCESYLFRVCGCVDVEEGEKGGGEEWEGV